MPTSLPSAPHLRRSSKNNWQTGREINGTVIAEPRFLVGSCGGPDAIVKRLPSHRHIFRAHHPPLWVWVTGLRIVDKMHNLDKVLEKAVSEFGENARHTQDLQER